MVERGQELPERRKNYSLSVIYSAFLLGFLGSLHCFSMCGPLSLLLPADRSRYLIGRLTYNTGRITTYALLGLLTGIAGEQAGFLIPQKILFILLGAVLLVYLLLPVKWKNRISVMSPVIRMASFTKRSLAKLSKRHGLAVQYGFGLVNGLIPCGLVYAALSGAFLTAGITDSMLFMILFGLGTLPMMMSFGVIGKILPSFLRVKPKLIYTVSYLVLAAFLLYKGFNLPVSHYANSHEITICRTP